jgi:hypothetical protein
MSKRRHSHEAYRHTFILNTLDGQEKPTDALHAELHTWMTEQGFRGFWVGYIAQERLSIRTIPAHLKVRLKADEAAFWFRMRWGTDVARLNRLIAEYRERCRDWLLNDKSHPRMDTVWVERKTRTMRPEYLDVETTGLSPYPYQGSPRPHAFEKPPAHPLLARPIPAWMKNALENANLAEHDAAISAEHGGSFPRPENVILIDSVEKLVETFGKPL